MAVDMLSAHVSDASLKVELLWKELWANGRRSTEGPAAQEPADEEPAVEEPDVEEPADEESAVEEPDVEEPADEESATEDSAAEEFAAEESVLKGHAADKSIVEKCADKWIIPEACSVEGLPDALLPLRETHVANEPHIVASISGQPEHDFLTGFSSKYSLVRRLGETTWRNAR
ncbi:hypothetical protein N7451_012050 [Penicillium sp. IBT 35674x]|nr:hypothetical protein N7451_012050 [Penicillium sp. IBT 35674x]